MRVCDEAVILEHGRMIARGRPGDIVREFRKVMTRETLAYGWDRGTKEIEIVSAEIFGADGSTPAAFSPGDEMIIQMDLKANVPSVEDPAISFAIHDEQNRLVYGTNNLWRQKPFPRFEGKHRVQFVVKSLPMVNGRFFVTLGVHSRDSRRVYHVQDQRYSFSVLMGEENPGLMWLPVEFRVEPL